LSLSRTWLQRRSHRLLVGGPRDREVSVAGARERVRASSDACCFVRQIANRDLERSQSTKLRASPRPAKTPTPIHRGTTEVFRTAIAYIGTTTPQRTTSPVQFTTSARTANVSAVVANELFVAASAAMYPGASSVRHSDRDQV
jgi:hypothetical protein